MERKTGREDEEKTRREEREEKSEERRREKRRDTQALENIVTNITTKYKTDRHGARINISPPPPHWVRLQKDSSDLQARFNAVVDDDDCSRSLSFERHVHALVACQKVDRRGARLQRCHRQQHGAVDHGKRG